MTANSGIMTKCLVIHLSNNNITVQASVKALRVTLDTHLGRSKLCLLSWMKGEAALSIHHEIRKSIIKYVGACSETHQTVLLSVV